MHALFVQLLSASAFRQSYYWLAPQAFGQSPAWQERLNRPATKGNFGLLLSRTAIWARQQLSFFCFPLCSACSRWDSSDLSRSPNAQLQAVPATPSLTVAMCPFCHTSCPRQSNAEPTEDTSKSTCSWTAAEAPISGRPVV